MFTANSYYVSRMLWATFEFYENHLSLEVSTQTYVEFLKILKLDKSKTDSTELTMLNSKMTMKIV